MTLGLTEDHEALHATARRFLEARCPSSLPRTYLDAPREEMPVFWSELAELGWLGLHLPEAYGGQGYSLVELAVVLEELGRRAAPGPLLATVIASALIAAGGSSDQRARLLPALADGSVTATVAWCGDPGATARPVAGGQVRLDGELAPVLSAHLAGTLVIPARQEGIERWWVLERSQAGVAVEELPSVDATRRVARVCLTGVELGPDQCLEGLERALVEDVAATLVAAECAGGAAWCLDTAVDYAKVREQFGRPIGQFQAVKHRCADMLVALEQARGTAWDAAGSLSAALGFGSYQAGTTTPGDEAALAVAAAATLGADVFAGCAKDCVQILGGIGFTWEHDAHIYLKRAVALRQLVGGPHRWAVRGAGLALGGARRHLSVDLPADSEEIRDRVRDFAESVRRLDRADQRRAVVDAGYFVPHWPEPWGRNASAIEQIVIDQEFRRARIRRDNLAVGAWAAPTIVAHGTPEQQERWVRPTLLGEIVWCQMFSEPGAGSDLASLATKAVPTSGGWLLSGQKVWTSLAASADWAICLARTNPTAPKHLGITYFIVDMRSSGIDIRPLRELTGEAMFNEIFLSDVFVPDDCVIGEVDAGWPLARTTLANERVAMGSGSSFGGGVESLLALFTERQDLREDPIVLSQLGRLLAQAQAVGLLGLRTTMRALGGSKPGPESSVRKLLGVEHDQHVQELGMTLLGPGATTMQGDAMQWVHGFLATRCLTIAGGTSEVQRNVIAERLLGLPRDP